MNQAFDHTKNFLPCPGDHEVLVITSSVLDGDVAHVDPEYFPDCGAGNISLGARTNFNPEAQGNFGATLTVQGDIMLKALAPPSQIAQSPFVSCVSSAATRAPPDVAMSMLGVWTIVSTVNRNSQDLCDALS